MGKRVILDKSFLQAASFNDLKKLHNSSLYRPFVTANLGFEIIGNLTKNNTEHEKKGLTKEQHTQNLFKKFEIFPYVPYLSDDLMRKELIENTPIKLKHDFFGYGLSSYQNSFDPFDNSIELTDDIQRWTKGEFINKDYELSKLYRDGLKKKEEEHYNKCKNYESLTIDEIISGMKTGGNFINLTTAIEKFICNHILKNLVDKQTLNKVVEKIKSTPLIKFAPYTAYVFTIYFIFCLSMLPQWTKDGSKKTTSHWIDFSYTCYFPFIDGFVTEEKNFPAFRGELKQYFEKKIQVIKKEDILNICR